jgi:excisionase family DNA binding protein
MEVPVNNQPLLTTAEAAGRLGLSPRTLEKWRSNGNGPRYRKLGAAVRYRVADLEAFARAGEQTGTEGPLERDRCTQVERGSTCGPKEAASEKTNT